MTYKHILVHVEPGAAGHNRLKYALSLAQSFDAKLTGIAVTLPPTSMGFATMGDGYLYDAAMQAAEECAGAANALFDEATAGCGIPTGWRNGSADPVEVIAAEAGGADLIVIGRDSKGGPDGAPYSLPPSHVVMTCGRPVLALPSVAGEKFHGQRVVVGWKSSREAARAVHDALPILSRADEVLLTEIVPQNNPAVTRYTISLEDVADHLRAHGARISTKKVLADESDLGDVLLRVAEHFKGDLIVAGGYGHSRVREWALGGVTYSLLHAGRLPCLLSH